MICAIEVTNQFQFIFDFIGKVYTYLMSIEFTAFGFTFSLLGIIFSLIFASFLISFLKFGFEVGADTGIRYARQENKMKEHDKRVEQRGGSKWI